MISRPRLFPRTSRRWTTPLILMALALGGCTDPEPGETAPDATAPPAVEATPAKDEASAVEGGKDAAPAPVENTGEAPATLYARIRVVDIQGEPLPGMTPIVTRQPNAFDEPVASGISTNLEGKGSIRFKTGEQRYLRAWDPALRYFPNNFYEVLPGGNSLEGELTIQMAPSANLEAQFFLPSGEPVREESVALMLYHPTRGPWWPAESNTDAEGVATFPNVPPGAFVFRFQVESGARLEHPQTPLPPAADVNLGALTLQNP